jgi:hypothetical protein
MNPMWLLRMSRWARRPPSLQRVVLVVAVIVLCLLLVGAEWLWGWPDWLTVNGRPRLTQP